jgi:hypothetical protein
MQPPVVLMSSDENGTFGPITISAKYATPQELFVFLKILAENPTSSYVKDALRGVVTKKLDYMLTAILKFDASLMNTLFDPSSATPASNKVSRTSFENIDKILLNSGNTSNKLDIYSLAAIFDTTEEDFDYILNNYFHPKLSSNQRFRKVIGIFERFFKPDKIPKLVAMVKNSYQPQFSALAWKHVDEKHIHVFADFIWDRLSRNIPFEDWPIYQKFHLKVALNIFNRCLLISQTSELCEIFFRSAKCFFFHSVTYHLLENDPDIGKIFQIKQRLCIKIASGLSEDIKDSILLALGNIYQKSEEKYRLKLIQVLLNNSNLQQKSTVEMLLGWIPNIDYGILPEHVKLLSKTHRQIGSAFWMKIFGDYFKYPNNSNFIHLRSTNRKFLLEFLIEVGDVKKSVGFFRWMSETHPLELRNFDIQIKELYLKNSNWADLFNNVRQVLSLKSQKAFDSLFCEKLEKGILDVAGYAIDNDDPVFLARMRKVIRRNLSDGDPKLRQLGILVAFYGEPKDLDVALSLPGNPAFLASFFKTFHHYKFEITGQQNISIIQNTQFYISPVVRPKDLSPQLGYILRQNPDKTELVDMIEGSVLKNSAFFYLEAELELLILRKNSDVDENDISRIVKHVYFGDVKHRFVEIWDTRLTDSAKKLLADSHQEFSLLYYSLNHPKFLRCAGMIFKREQAVLVIDRYQKTLEMCVGKVILLAQWFFVDNFEKEIATFGYLGFFEVADSIKTEIAWDIQNVK